LYRLFYEESDIHIKKVKEAAHDCGVIGAKLLQFIMMHDGFLSVEGKKHFGYVFEDCPCHTWSDTCRLYREDFGKEIEEDFMLNEDSAVVVGSGSIGQVYKLWNKELGKFVAVKVRHPGVAVEAVRFIKTVTLFIRLVQLVKSIPFSFLLREFLNNVHCQLDYATEAKNTNHLHTLFEKETCVVVPQVFRDSSNFIVMDYYEGKTFYELDETVKRMVSCYLYLFMVTSNVCYDFLHCDLHYGNWKMTKDNKLVVYDCGIIGTTHNPALNESLTMMFEDGDFTGMGELLLTQKDARLQERIKTYMAKDYVNSSDRVTDIVKEITMCNVSLNIDVFRCFQGYMTCTAIIKKDTDRLVQLLGKNGNNKHILTCYYHGLLQKLEIYKDLQQALEKWMHRNPTTEQVFYDWLEDSFGHRDKEVFIEVMLGHMFPALKRQ
jgi:hypothetical protein